MFTERTSLGLDVHAHSVQACAIDMATGEIIRRALPAEATVICGFVDELAGAHGPVLVTYEAGPTGYELARGLGEAGHHVQVAAPSKLLKAPGDKVKTDRNDAMLLARLARNDDITAVRIPTRERESARDLVRARDDVRRDLVERDFTAQAPGLTWVGDITCIRTLEGFCYLATVLDCCTKKAVGYAVADHMRTGLISDALDMAVRNCPPARGETIFHSDHGSQYMSREYADLLDSYGIRASVGKTGVCWDNAWAESFNATLKNERVHRMVYRTVDEAVRDVVSWIELRYNQKRLHSALGYRTPNEAEADYWESRKCA